MDEIKLIEQLIAKSDDPAEIEKLKARQLEIIDERARARAKKEVREELAAETSEELKSMKEAKEAAERQLAELRESGSFGEFRDGAPVKTGLVDTYRGHNLKRAAAEFTKSLRQRGSYDAVKRAEANPEGLERLLKAFTDMRADSMDNPVTKDQLEGTDAAGGYLVHDEDRDELLAYARDQSVALRRARVVRMNSDTLTMPREDAKVSLTFSNESTDMTEESATFAQVSLDAEDLDGYSDVSLHLEMDNTTPGGVVGVLLDQFTEAYGQKIDQRVFEGAAVASSAFDEAGYSVTLSSTFSSLTVEKLRNTIGKLKPVRRAGAAWFGEYSVVWDHLYGVQEDSKSVLIPDARRAVGNQVLGYPLEELTEGPSTDTSGLPMLLFGNLNGYLVGERLNTLTLFRDPYTQRKSKLIRYYFFTRVGFQMALPNNFVKIINA